jgi:oligopeptide/dipeptide ABC transporter ATP-binding protein
VSGPLLELDGVERHFVSRKGTVRAVDGVSLSVGRNESVGLVGESGSGKTTLGRIALRLHDVGAGRVVFDGDDVTALTGESLRKLRRRFQMVFQDPISTLNPRMCIGDIVAEPLRELLGVDRPRAATAAAAALERVHLLPAMADRYPRELSGGQAQRVGIARALVVEPQLVVADEPIASLDASVAAQIVELMIELREQEGVSYLFISHDLPTVRRLCDRVAVMYLGRIVEEGPTAEVFSAPRHPYTAALLSATPTVEGALNARRRRIVLRADPQQEWDSRGCRFRGRCPIGPGARDGRALCAEREPELAGSGEHTSACHFPQDVGQLVGTDAEHVERRAV